MKNTVALVVALVLGALGFAAMHVVMSRQADRSGGSDRAVSLTPVVVAKRNLPSGTRISEDYLEVAKIPSEYVSSAYIEESKLTTLVGHTLRMTVQKGEPILVPAVEFEAASAPKEIETQIHAPDRLAVAIELEEAESLAGLIRPGQKVDVMGTFDVKLRFIGPPGTSAPSKDPTQQESITRTLFLMQNRTVLAVDVITQSRYEGDPRTVTKHIFTLAVTPEEALRLAVLQARGDGHIALRHSLDNRVEPIPPVGAEIVLEENEILRKPPQR